MLRTKSSSTAPPSPQRPRTMEYLQRRASSLILRTPASNITNQKSRLSSLSSSTATNNSRPVTPRLAVDMPLDPTPSNPAALEGLLNYHLSQLSTLSPRLVWLDEQVDRDLIVLDRLQREEGRAREATSFQERVDVQYACRKSLSRLSKWHQAESDRIKALLVERGGKAKLSVQW